MTTLDDVTASAKAYADEAVAAQKSLDEFDLASLREQLAQAQSVIAADHEDMANQAATIADLQAQVAALEAQLNPPPVDPTEPPVARDKAHIAGMVSRNGHPVVDGGHVVIEWVHALVEPARGVYDFSSIDRAIADAKDDGATGVRLRGESGMSAPGWAKSLYGVVHVVDPQKVRPAFDTVRWWLPQFQADCLALDAALAARYDDDDFVFESMLWSHGSEFSTEWNIHQAGDKANRAAYAAAGYDYHQDQANILAGVEAFATTWKRTHLHTWVSKVFQVITPAGEKEDDPDFTEAVIRKVAEVLPTASIGPNSADNSKGSGVDQPTDAHYAMCWRLSQELGLRLAIQTATAKKVGDCAAFFSATNMQAAKANHVASIEVPAASGLSKAQYQAAQDALLS